MMWTEALAPKPSPRKVLPGYGRQASFNRERDIPTMSDYSWITKPPIQVFDGENKQDCIDFSTRVLFLGNDIWRYSQGLTDADPDQSPLAKLTYLGDAKVSRAHQSDNLRAARTMVEKMKPKGSIATNDRKNILESGQVGAAYMVAGRPVALLVLGGDYIYDLLCHPGVEGAAGILVEWAVNHVVQSGREPILRLWPLGGPARAAYVPIGFDENDGWRLDARKSPQKWSQLNGAWTYTSATNPGSRYLSAEVKPIPPPQ
jgi:hypothetical protein